MPLGQPVAVLPSLLDAIAGGHHVPPPVHKPFGWTLILTPDFDDWQSGDIVLVEKRGINGALIAVGQGILLSSVSSNTQWSHCGIYIGGGRIVDAMPGKNVGVRKRLLDDYTSKRATALLRLAIDGTLIDPAIGRLVARAAEALLTYRYSIKNLAALAVRFLLKKAGIVPGMKPVAKDIKKLYCSSLVVVAYRAIGVNIDYDPNVLPCMPANLPAHQDLYSQVTDWRPII